MFLHKESAMIGYYTGGDVTVFALPKLEALKVPVIRPGKGKKDDHKKKHGGQQNNLQGLIVYHDLTSPAQYFKLMAAKP